MMPIADLAPEIALIVTAVAIVILASFTNERTQWLSAVLALIGLGVSSALLLAQQGTVTTTFSGTWVIDGASLWGRLMILIATMGCVLMAPHWFASDRRHGEFYAILLFSTLGAMAMASAGDLLQLVMGVLLSSVTGYTLAAYHRNWALSLEAGMKYFLLGALATALLVIGVVFVYGMLGATGYTELVSAFVASDTRSPLLLVGVALMAVGLTFKLGAVPAHAWVPDVAEGAPVPAAAFLTIVPKIGAAIALARLVAMMPLDGVPVRPMIAMLALLSMTLGNLAALWQDDIRRLLGWSSVSQAGYLLMAIAVLGGSDFAWSALLIFVMSYAAGNLAAFAVVAHLRGRTRIQDYAGLAGQHPLTSAVLVLSFLSLVGIPPVIGFFGKLLLFVSTIDGAYTWLAIAAAINTVISLFYYARVLAVVYFDDNDVPMATLGRWSALVVLLSGFLIIALALATGAILDTFSDMSVLPTR